MKCRFCGEEMKETVKEVSCDGDFVAIFYECDCDTEKKNKDLRESNELPNRF